MARVRQRDTRPEMIVRRILHRAGYRYRLHAGDLPGRPDIVFRRLRKVIFVHGCFWHRHEGCRRATTPKARRTFWQNKFDENRRRDAASVSALKQQGWEVTIVWECETDDPHALKARLASFLERRATASDLTWVECRGRRLEIRSDDAT